MKTKVLIKMHICIRVATFKVVSIESYESMVFVGELMRCPFLSSILAFGRGHPRDSTIRSILGDTHNIAFGISFVESSLSTQPSPRRFGVSLLVSASPVSS